MSAITLDDMLAARDARCCKQRQLLKAHPDATLVVLTVVLPGNEKRNDTSLQVARAAVKAVTQALHTDIQHAEQHDLLRASKLLDGEGRTENGETENGRTGRKTSLGPLV